MFIDETTIKAKAGDGGKGCVSFRREKYEPWGGPNGGDGANGGDVVLRGDDDTNNLIDFKFKPHWTGERGGHGLGKDCNGHVGKHAILQIQPAIFQDVHFHPGQELEFMSVFCQAIVPTRNRRLGST